MCLALHKMRLKKLIINKQDPAGNQPVLFLCLKIWSGRRAIARSRAWSQDLPPYRVRGRWGGRKGHSPEVASTVPPCSSPSTPGALLMNISEVKNGFSEGGNTGLLTSLRDAEVDSHW